jgi:16S rRNA G527 N7-methylase RsmG
MKHYCEQLREYNKVHRLIGNVSCETLIAESLKALKSTKALSEFDLMIDVGAGAGILGQAWLSISPDHKAVFMEPDKKALAFLRGYYSNISRATVVGSKLENFVLSEISEFALNTKGAFLAARAFSSSGSIDDLYRESGLSLPLFVFEKDQDKAVMKKKF